MWILLWNVHYSNWHHIQLRRFFLSQPNIPYKMIWPIQTQYKILSMCHLSNISMLSILASSEVKNKENSTMIFEQIKWPIVFDNPIIFID